MSQNGVQEQSGTFLRIEPREKPPSRAQPSSLRQLQQDETTKLRLVGRRYVAGGRCRHVPVTSTLCRGSFPFGEVAARKVAVQLKSLEIPPAEYAALRKRQMVEVTPDLRPVDEIRI